MQRLQQEQWYSSMSSPSPPLSTDSVLWFVLPIHVRILPIHILNMRGAKINYANSSTPSSNHTDINTKWKAYSKFQMQIGSKGCQMIWKNSDLCFLCGEFYWYSRIEYNQEIITTHFSFRIASWKLWITPITSSFFEFQVESVVAQNLKKIESPSWKISSPDHSNLLFRHRFSWFGAFWSVNSWILWLKSREQVQIGSTHLRDFQVKSIEFALPHRVKGFAARGLHDISFWLQNLDLKFYILEVAVRKSANNPPEESISRSYYSLQPLFCLNFLFYHWPAQCTFFGKNYKWHQIHEHGEKSGR